jgi:hypothetical protein
MVTDEDHGGQHRELAGLQRNGEKSLRWKMREGRQPALRLAAPFVVSAAQLRTTDTESRPGTLSTSVLICETLSKRHTRRGISSSWHGSGTGKSKATREP